ncbi:putative uncharacterized protein WWC2-AS2 [Meriones unguiculatus]|uniref:putative uncharacterized protein WWC2-AS2 n=1 Tax=Meriones unguiculatus TaxID=10047 RepID=UPI00293F1277|nr:putative uncharacterized protein WWC2-AS2 [Meriones unguiculatus]
MNGCERVLTGPPECSLGDPALRPPRAEEEGVERRQRKDAARLPEAAAAAAAESSVWPRPRRLPREPRLHRPAPYARRPSQLTSQTPAQTPRLSREARPGPGGQLPGARLTPPSSLLLSSRSPGAETQEVPPRPLIGWHLARALGFRRRLAGRCGMWG